MLFASCSGKEQIKPEFFVGRKVPPAQVQLLNGNTTMFGTSRKPEVLMFWASWCSRSLSQLDDLEELAEQERSGARFYAVSVDDEEKFEDVEARLQSYEVDDVVVGFSGNGPADQAFRQFRGEELPLVIGVSSARRVIYVGDDVEDAWDKLQAR